MEVVSARSALLSNFEVYKFLLEQKRGDAEDAAEDATAAAVGVGAVKGQQMPGVQVRKKFDVGDGLVGVRDQVLRHLAQEPLPTLRQDEESMRTLLKELRQWDLTKAEKLQIVNLAPDSAVMLYSIVEEMEDRFPTDGDGILAAVSASLAATPIQPPPELNVVAMAVTESGTTMGDDAEGDVDDGGWEQAEQQQYVDEGPLFGAGAGDDLQDGMDED